MWHSSIALMDMRRRRPIPVADWEAKRAAKARGRLVALLAGVGVGADHWKAGDAAIHLRRRLSDSEMARIDPRWLALPAIDGA